MKIPFAVAVFLFIVSLPAKAQPVPDDSLGAESSVVLPSDPRSNILGGASRGENLFHSFDSFNVEEGAEVYFDSPDGISRIFSRVTGSTPSEILGTLGVSGFSDLFFLNQNGILLGPSSALDLNGSLVLSTASSIDFADDAIFGTQTGSTPFLSQASPIELNLSTPSAIRIENIGSVPVAPLPPSVLVSRPINDSPSAGLSLSPENTLAVVASDIDLAGAVIRSTDGRIVLGTGNASLSPDGLGWNLDFSADLATPGRVQLREATVIKATGEQSGEIEVSGRTVEILDGSLLQSANFGGDRFSGGININASTLNVGSKLSSPAPTSNSIFSQSISAGRGGDIVVEADSINILNGAQTLSTATDSASAGDIRIDSERIAVEGTDPLKPFLSSAINNVTYGAGSSGDIEVITDSLQIVEGGIISTSTISTGQAGEVTVTATEATVSGAMPIVFRPSFIGSITTGEGDSGDFNFEARNLTIDSGGAIGTSTLGSSGDAGDTSITASNSITIRGTGQGNNRSSIISNSASTSEAVQQASEVDGELVGNSGNLSLKSPSIELQNRGFIGVQNDGLIGSAGSIAIDADSLEVTDSSNITASTAGGQGGNLEISANSAFISEQSSIEASAQMAGDGGNVSIDAQIIGLFEDSQISADAEEGQGGRVEVLSRGNYSG